MYPRGAICSPEASNSHRNPLSNPDVASFSGAEERRVGAKSKGGCCRPRQTPFGYLHVVDWLVALVTYSVLKPLSSRGLIRIFNKVGMKALLKTYLVYLLSIAIVSLALPSPAVGGGGFPSGKPSSDEAAAPALRMDNVSPFGAIGHAFAFGDTTDYEFPEEEEAKGVWKDVALWLVVAGFAAFFIIKVFLEGDKDEPAKEEGGKEIPPTAFIVPQPSPPSPGGP